MQVFRAGPSSGADELSASSPAPVPLPGRPVSPPDSSPRLDLGSLMLSRDAWGHLVGTDASGQRAVGLSAIPCFPFSAGSESIALVDGAGREWALVERWSQLSDSVREELQQALNYRYLIPVVEQIVAVSQRTLPADWTFRTSSGTVTLSLRDEDAFRPLPDGRMLITDSSGFRLLIPDRERLDKSSREILRRHI